MRQAKLSYLIVAIYLACGFVRGSQKTCSSYEDPSTCNLAACSWKAQCTAINTNNLCKEAKTEDDCVADGCTWVSDSGKVSGCRDIVAEYCKSLGELCAESAAFFCREHGSCEERSNVLLREVSQFAKQAIGFFKKSDESLDRRDQKQTRQEWGLTSAQSNWEFNARSADRFLSSNDTPPSPGPSPSPTPPSPSPTPPSPSPTPPSPSPPAQEIQLITTFSLSTCLAFEGSSMQAAVRGFCDAMVSIANFPEETYCVVQISTCSSTSPGRVLLQTASVEAKIVQQGTFDGLTEKQVQDRAIAAVDDIQGFKVQVVNVLQDDGSILTAEKVRLTEFFGATVETNGDPPPVDKYDECSTGDDCEEDTPFCLDIVPSICVQCLTGSDCESGTCSKLNECVALPSPSPSPTPSPSPSPTPSPSPSPTPSPSPSPTPSPPPPPSHGRSLMSTLPLVVLGISCVISMAT